MIPVDELSDPTVRSIVEAINAGDREAFRAAFTPDRTMSDDGTERDFDAWTDREIFAAGGHMEVESQSDDGRALIARYRNDTYGEMRTSWRFVLSGERVSHMETGQA
jgi:hypothetical protein